MACAGLLLAVLLPCTGALARPSPQAQFAATAQSPQLLQVEGAFLINFLRFTQWPPARFASADAPYVIAVVGPDDVADTVRNVAGAAGAIQGRRVAVVQVDPEDVEAKRQTAVEILRGCHLVFIASDDDDVHAQALKAVEGTSVLTVGDAPDFAARGGMLGLVRSGSHLAFEANLQEIQAAGVQVSAKVLKLARMRRGRST